MKAARALGLVAVAGLIGPGSAAQEPIYVERIDVNVVNIEVVVTRHGKPVNGLGRDSFKIVDDGGDVEISNFYEVHDGARSVGLDFQSAGGVGEPPLEKERAHIVILIDNTFLSPATRKQSLSELRKYFDSIRSQQNLIMVVTHDTSIRVEQSFTNDATEIDAAIVRALKTTSSGGMTMSSERILQRKIEAAPGDPDVPDAELEALEVLSFINGYAEEVAMNVRRSTYDIERFLGSLAGIPGRKAVIYLADTIPTKPAERLFHMWFEKWGQAFGARAGLQSPEIAIENYDSSTDLDNLIAGASANRVAFYPISSNSDPSLIGLSASNAGSNVSSITPGTAARMSSLGSNGLKLMARATGGSVASETAGVASLVQVLETDLGSYYSLGFNAPHGGDGKTHNVEVVVDEPGVEVRYLRSYRDKTGDEKIRDKTLSALFLQQTNNPLEAWVEVGKPEREKKNRYLVPIEVKFPLGNLTLVPEAQSHRGSVSICVIVRSDEGEVSEATIIPVPVSIPNEQILAANNSAAAWPTKLAMRPGAQLVGISIRDDVTMISSTVQVAVDIEAPKK